MKKQENVQSDREEITPWDLLPWIFLITLTLGLGLTYFGLFPEALVYGQKGKKGYVERCIDGVAYIDTGRGITPKIDKTSSVVVCGG